MKTERYQSTITVHGHVIEVRADPDRNAFAWSIDSGKNETRAMRGVAETVSSAWEKAISWLNASVDIGERDLVTWDRLADSNLDVSPEARAAIPALPYVLGGISRCAAGLDGVLRVLRANGVHEEFHGSGPENGGNPLSPYAVGQLEAAAQALVDCIMEKTKDLAAWKPAPR